MLHSGRSTRGGPRPWPPSTDRDRPTVHGYRAGPRLLPPGRDPDATRS
ncbi:hypothetical protein Ae168Ps1_3080 [Pseudonocardia sp. Ae168_Ps1]|nr:hypothetical protein Ae168Ps1_3080 [Pseudonocardia sp. Ae168_Ps1]